MTHECKQEGTIKDLVEHKGSTESSLKTLFEMLKGIKENDLYHLNEKMDCVIKKVSNPNKRPSWAVCTIITLLTAACVLLARELLSRL